MGKHGRPIVVRADNGTQLSFSLPPCFDSAILVALLHHVVFRFFWPPFICVTMVCWSASLLQIHHSLFAPGQSLLLTLPSPVAREQSPSTTPSLILASSIADSTGGRGTGAGGGAACAPVMA